MRLSTTLVPALLVFLQLCIGSSLSKRQNDQNRGGRRIKARRTKSKSWSEVGESPDFTSRIMPRTSHPEVSDPDPPSLADVGQQPANSNRKRQHGHDPPRHVNIRHGKKLRRRPPQSQALSASQKREKKKKQKKRAMRNMRKKTAHLSQPHAQAGETGRKHALTPIRYDDGNIKDNQWCPPCDVRNCPLVSPDTCLGSIHKDWCGCCPVCNETEIYHQEASPTIVATLAWAKDNSTTPGKILRLKGVKVRSFQSMIRSFIQLRCT